MQQSSFCYCLSSFAYTEDKYFFGLEMVRNSCLVVKRKQETYGYIYITQRNWFSLFNCFFGRLDSFEGNKNGSREFGYMQAFFENIHSLFLLQIATASDLNQNNVLQKTQREMTPKILIKLWKKEMGKCTDAVN